MHRLCQKFRLIRSEKIHLLISKAKERCCFRVDSSGVLLVYLCLQHKCFSSSSCAASCMDVSACVSECLSTSPYYVNADKYLLDHCCAYPFIGSMKRWYFCRSWLGRHLPGHVAVSATEATKIDPYRASVISFKPVEFVAGICLCYCCCCGCCRCCFDCR